MTIEALKEYALQTNQRVRLEIEVRAGEHKVEVGKARSEQQLQKLLGNGTKPSQIASNQTGNTVSQSVTGLDPSDNLPPKAPKVHKIERLHTVTQLERYKRRT